MGQWIWYNGDFEIYHAMKQNFDREERGMKWPAYWYVSDWNHNVSFQKRVNINRPLSLVIHVQGEGYLRVIDTDNQEEKKYPLAQNIDIKPGNYQFIIHVCNLTGLPCIFVDSSQLATDTTWQASNHLAEYQPVGSSDLFHSNTQNPMEFPYQSTVVRPIKSEQVNGGTLLDYGHDISALTTIQFHSQFAALTLSYGESRTEALDVAQTYLRHTLKEYADPLGKYDEPTKTFTTKTRAFRYLFISGVPNLSVIRSLHVIQQSIAFPQHSSFHSDDAQLSEIWSIADRTLRLCSGIFFIDGIKRDRWIWSGDAFQAYYMNRYDFFDKAIVERTILGLRGETTVHQHLNTIIDYSMYWIISIDLYYQTFADKTFLASVYDKLKALMDYTLAATDKNGFVYGRKGDWIYIDWADFDHDGPLCAEQILLARALTSMITVSKYLAKPYADYARKLDNLTANIDRFYWDASKNAYVDSWTSGKQQVSRHANIFAILFDLASPTRQHQILHHVLNNSNIPAINTPFFKFWELEAMAKLGQYSEMLAAIKSYWGGMLDAGATTFWEYFDPKETGPEKYAMYGDKYGKSLCHAWGASPLYLIGRYLVGLEPTAPGYETFIVKPQVDLLGDFNCTYPLDNHGNEVQITAKNGHLSARASKQGGTLIVNGQSIIIPNDLHQREAETIR